MNPRLPFTSPTLVALRLPSLGKSEVFSPSPWRVEQIPGGYKVLDASGQSLAFSLRDTRRRSHKSKTQLGVFHFCAQRLRRPTCLLPLPFSWLLYNAGRSLSLV
jgi:hypothetical protein